jgi:protein SDA1
MDRQATQSGAAAGGGVPMTLAGLQNVLKRDPEAYREEFLQQWRHYESNLEIFRLRPADQSQDFQDLVSFVAAVAPCYPDVVQAFPQQVMDLLDKNAKVLDAELRQVRPICVVGGVFPFISFNSFIFSQCLCRALILMRNRDLLGPSDLMALFFRLFRVPDKPLRELLYTHIVGDIRRLNQKHKSNAVNKTLQNFMYTMLSDANEVAAKRSMDVMMELYRRGIWQDERTTNVIAAGLFSPVAKIKAAALKFFLSSHLERPEDDDNGDDNDTYQDVLRRSEFQKKTKKRASQVGRGWGFCGVLFFVCGSHA